MDPDERAKLPEELKTPGEPWAQGEWQAQCETEALLLHPLQQDELVPLEDPG